MNDIAKAIPLLYAGAAVAVIYLVWRYTNKGADAIGKPLAEFLVSLRGVPAEIAEESNNVVLPNGQKITWNQVLAAGGSLKSDNTFYWQGIRYRVTGRGDNGAWQTILA